MQSFSLEVTYPPLPLLLAVARCAGVPLLLCSAPGHFTVTRAVGARQSGLNRAVMSTDQRIEINMLS